jgi:hypothetical protein
VPVGKAKAFVRVAEATHFVKQGNTTFLSSKDTNLFRGKESVNGVHIG